MASSDKKPKKKRKHVCEYEGCSAAFRRPDRLKHHLKLHKNERPFICSYDDCDKTYIQQHHLKRHEDTHDGAVKCTEANCDKIFVSKATLKKHVDNIHLNKKPKKYKCSHCDQEFNKHSWLAQHEYRHTNIKPYKCPEKNCGKGFLLPSKLKRHLKIHEGYPCTKPNCDKIFSNWTKLVTHLKIAHPKIYKCDICEKEFFKSFNIRKHLETHRLDRTAFLCPRPNCSKFYFTKWGLSLHIKSYHDERPFRCTVDCCEKAFKTQTALDAHLPRHDPNKRFRKRKKKNKQKPSFAAVLAGCVKRKCDKDRKSEIAIENTAITEAKDKEIPIENTAITEAKDQEIPEVHENNQEDISKSDKTEYTDIQTLLRMIAKRKNINSESITNIKTNFISLKA